MKSTKETKKRSIAKTISWRVCATFITMLIVYLFTKKISLSLGVGAVEVIAKMTMYYLHERAWGKLSWGCERHILSHLPIKDELTAKDLDIIHNKLIELGYIDQKRQA